MFDYFSGIQVAIRARGEIQTGDDVSELGGWKVGVYVSALVRAFVRRASSLSHNLDSKLPG